MYVASSTVIHTYCIERLLHPLRMHRQLNISQQKLIITSGEKLHDITYNIDLLSSDSQ